MIARTEGTAMNRVTDVIGIGAIAFSVALAGCGGSAKNSRTTTAASRTSPAVTMTKQQAGQAYLAAVLPANAAGAALARKIRAYTNSTPGSRISAAARPLERRLTELNGKLLGIATAYPPAAADLKALVAAYTPVIRDLRGAATQSSVNAPSWLQGLADDLTKTQKAATTVRSDLGLPPTKS
ncbi:MAG TPA: hypothetical protein VJ741_02800 [Solirubrobacteraceae bacterium]|nr:hypothetical protein [Solirubrobacteraceae bacterium]